MTDESAKGRPNGPVRTPLESQPWRLLYPFVGLMGVIALVGLGVCLVTPQDATDPQIVKLVNTDAYLLWRFMIGCILALTFVSALVTVPLVRRRTSELELRKRFWFVVAGAILLVAVGVALFVAPGLIGIDTGPSDLFMHTIRCGMGSVFAISGAFLLPAVVLLLVVNAWVGSYGAWLSEQVDCGVPIAIDGQWRTVVEGLRNARADLSTALVWLASVISLVVLITGQLRNTYIAADSSVRAEYPVEYVLAYGATFAAILAAAYLPIYRRLQAVANRLADATFPVGKLRDDAGVDRESLGDLLQLSSSGAAQFKMAFATLAPFAASLVSFFLPEAS